MYNKIKPTVTTITVREAVEGETIEQKVERIVENKEPIKDGSPTYYTERSEGVLDEYNPRADKWDIAIDAMDKVHKNNLTKRQEAMQRLKNDGKTDAEMASEKAAEAAKNSGTEDNSGTSVTV